MQRICVFAGSRPGKRSTYFETARALGQELAARGLTLVYGGGGVGLMGAVADTTLDADGQVIGVMPRGLFVAEAAHRQLTELRETGTMHERKRMMYDLADGFIALPGGFGTFDELIEIITWAQIGIHHKPIVLLNVDNYFAPLLALIENAIAEGFIEERYRGLFTIATTPAEAVDQALTPRAPIAGSSEKAPLLAQSVRRRLHAPGANGRHPDDAATSLNGNGAARSNGAASNNGARPAAHADHRARRRPAGEADRRDGDTEVDTHPTP